MVTSGIAIVVGAGSGIGLETALTFAERGARGVVFADKNLDAVHNAAEKSKTIATAKDYQALSIEVDVASRQAVRSMVAETVSKFGRIDYAVNCAGVPRLKEASLDQIAEEEFELLHNVNCRGVMHCLQEEIEAMKSQEECFVDGRSGRRSVGRGSITVITSLSAVLGAPKSATYVASKFAARGVVKVAGKSNRYEIEDWVNYATALENLKTGIRINEICPGFTNTPMLINGLKGDENLKAIIDRAMPLGRVASPEEIAGVAYFLATPSASYIHGQSIVVDSGASVAIHR